MIFIIFLLESTILRCPGRACSGIPWWLSSRESACQAGDAVSIPGSGRSPGEGNSNSLHYSCLENPMDRGARHATVHGRLTASESLGPGPRNLQVTNPLREKSLSDQIRSVRLFATPWIAAHQTSLSITKSQSSLRLTSQLTFMALWSLKLCRHFPQPVSPHVSCLTGSLSCREARPSSYKVPWVWDRPHHLIAEFGPSPLPLSSPPDLFRPSPWFHARTSGLALTCLIWRSWSGMDTWL